MHRTLSIHSLVIALVTGTALALIGPVRGTEPAAVPGLPATLPSLPRGFAPDSLSRIVTDAQQLRDKLVRWQTLASASRSATRLDRYADADVFHKGLVWALRYETSLGTNDVKLIRQAILRGTQRTDNLLAGQAPWAHRKGKVLRGYVSAVDGSTQPYGVIVPAGYDGSKPIRLDVVLHGSTKPVGLSELRFGSRFDEGDGPADKIPEADYIELHPLGRVENCYRWAGETDVFEAIESACRNYNIDRDRIVLRGMSMGASGTWHLGLKHPSRFVALGPYCGYVDTHRFSETPLPNFIRVGPLPPHQERILHMLDSVDYAANASVVPAIAAIGEKDIFFQAHVIMGDAMAREGLDIINLISPGTGHTIDPVTQGEQLNRIGEYAVRGLDHAARRLRFVTWTLKYNRCHWIELLALGEHYERAEVSAELLDDGTIDIQEPRNIVRFAVHPPALKPEGGRVRIGGRNIPLPSMARGTALGALVFVREPAGWRCAGARKPDARRDKRPGVQGPIDDAFTGPFLCVRGTGTPWNPAVGAWAEANLRRFSYEWARYMRGDLPVKNDTDITEEDIRTKHLILFGDPGSNPWIRKALPGLPISWDRKAVAMAGQRQPADNHAPALVCSSPFKGADGRYVVLNSGHTFHESEFAAVNYLLFPRLGDWAMVRIQPGSESWQPGQKPFPEEIVEAGFLDEHWTFGR